jgi:hypothetical protein
LETGYDVVLWLDTDTVVLDPTKDPISEVPEDAYQAVCLVQTEGETLAPNMGVWILKNDPRTFAFLDELWAQEDLIEHKWWEQGAVCRLLGYPDQPPFSREDTKWTAGVHWMSDEWNANRHIVREGVRIRHYAGWVPTRVRESMIRADVHHLNGRHVAARLELARLRLNESIRHRREQLRGA